MCSEDTLCNISDLNCKTQDVKQFDVIQNIIKDNDDLRLLFRDLGERAKEILQSDDQKENLKSYKNAYWQKTHEMKQMHEQLCSSKKLHRDLLEDNKKTKNKIVIQKANIEELELKLVVYEEDLFKIQEIKERQRCSKNQIKRLDAENIELSYQLDQMTLSVNEEQEHFEQLKEENCNLDQHKKELESLQEQVTGKESCHRQSIEEQDILIEKIKTNIYDCKCEGRDIQLKIQNLKEKSDADEDEFKRKKQILVQLEAREKNIRTQVNELRADNKKYQDILQQLLRDERSLRLQLHDKQQLFAAAKRQLLLLIAKVNLCKRCKMIENHESCAIIESYSVLSDSGSFTSSIKSSTDCNFNKKTHFQKQLNSCEEEESRSEMCLQES